MAAFFVWETFAVGFCFLATFFDLVQIPINDVSAQNQLIQDGEDSPEDVRRHAEEWIAENQEQFDTWIQEAMDAGMQASN